MKTEKLNALAAQAGFDVERLRAPYPGGFPREDILALESFAELIVREVLAVQEQFIAEGHNAWHLNKPTKEHFGVEE
jgi:hypothetical protein